MQAGWCVIVIAAAVFLLALFVVILLGLCSPIPQRVFVDLWHRLVFRCKFLFGYGITHDPKTKQHGIENVIALLNFVVINGAGLIVLQQNVGPAPWGVLAIFALACALPLAGLFAISTSPAARVSRINRSNYYAYDRTTVIFSKTMFWLSSAAVVLFAIAAKVGYLPLQSRNVVQQLDARYVRATKLKDGTTGLIIEVPVARRDFVDGVPSPLELHVRANAELHRKWFFSEAWVYPADVKPTRGNELKGDIWWRGPLTADDMRIDSTYHIHPLDPNRNYVVHFHFERRTPNGDLAKATEEIERRDGVTIYATHSTRPSHNEPPPPDRGAP